MKTFKNLDKFIFSDARGHIDVWLRIIEKDGKNNLEDPLYFCIQRAIEGKYYFLGSDKKSGKISNKINKLLYPFIGNKKLYKIYKKQNKHPWEPKISFKEKIKKLFNNSY